MNEVVANPVCAPVPGGIEREGSLAFLLGKIGHQVSASYAAALGELGLRPPHAAVLRFVSDSPGISQQRLSKAIGVPQNRLVAVIDALEAGGLLERRPNAEDRRSHALHVTSRGAASVERIAEVAGDLEARLRSAVPPADRSALAHCLDSLSGMLEVAGPAHPPRSGSR